MTMIRIDNLSLPFGIHSLSCDLPAGRLIGVLGPNGAGKSSLIKAIAGILPPRCGEIYFNNQPLSQLSHQQRGAKLAYLAQNTPLYWQLRVFDVIALGLVSRLSVAQTTEKVHAIAEQFDIKPLLEKSFTTLSGGEKARVHLARCVIKDTPILLADEPIAALDPYYQIEMMQHFKRLSKRMTCIVVMHHLSLAYRYCDEILLLHNGRLADFGTAQSVLITENLASVFRISATIDPINRNIHDIQINNDQPQTD